MLMNLIRGKTTDEAVDYIKGHILHLVRRSADFLEDRLDKMALKRACLSEALRYVAGRL